MFKHKVLLTASATLGILASLSLTPSYDEVKAASSHLDFFDCNPGGSRISEVDTDAGFREYLDLIGVPYQKYIARENKTLTIQKDYAINKCLIVYGGPNSVSSDRTDSQDWQDGQPNFLGYTEKGALLPNPLYPDTKPEYNYIGIKPFVWQPWENQQLLNDINTNPDNDVPKPIAPGNLQPDYYDPSIGKVRNRPEELDRAVDRMYLQACGSVDGCVLGKRGYFPQNNTALGHNMMGTNLQYYANVIQFPNAYSAGIFSVQYYKGPSASYPKGKWWYASYYLPPYKAFLQESRDLSVEITSINPEQVMAEEKYDVHYKVCNFGQLPVKNPVIHYGEAGSSMKSKTLNRTLQERDCYSDTITETAKKVSRDTNTTYNIEVNKDKTNPRDENNWSNNISYRDFKIIKRVINGSIKIIGSDPVYPHSNQNVVMTYRVCNYSNVKAENVRIETGFNSPKDIRTISSLDVGECATRSDTVKTPVVKNYEGKVPYIAEVTGGFEDDEDPSDNRDTYNLTVRNPNAAVDIIVSNDSSNNEFGNVKVKVENMMFKTISNTCSGADCRSGSYPKEFKVNIYDTKFTTSTGDDALVKTLTFNYNIPHNDNQYFNIDRSIFLDWVRNQYKDTYQLVQFRITADIPHYGTEVDFEGNPKYNDNSDENTTAYFPPRPGVAATQCQNVNHSLSNYFNTNGGFNPIKACYGHYPTYPSTTVESGMQAYHYVLYRFFPTPIPRYSVITPEADIKNPNHFSQLFTLNENKDSIPDFDSAIYPGNTANTANGVLYLEKGRYMPTGGTFDFEVYKNKTNGSKGETIALGTVSYNIPNTCYSNTQLDMKHQYGCDEILFFLPNVDTIKKHEKPSSYNASKVTYPIKNTKIPYLNPGKYSFEFKANENFRYYYQSNESRTGYDWGKPVFK
ncbi:hypothetical protein [Bacillus toyonensis]|uniref:hypothetical protein n=1 Tax=Bacillus toyonensis TaxID=155322 RepID=UPI002E1ED654|nr:hypothetical protein [Bacillus toyonensis]